MPSLAIMLGRPGRLKGRMGEMDDAAADESVEAEMTLDEACSEFFDAVKSNDREAAIDALKAAIALGLEGPDE